jgi:hypothetical protein
VVRNTDRNGQPFLLPAGHVAHQVRGGPEAEKGASLSLPNPLSLHHI